MGEQNDTRAHRIVGGMFGLETRLCEAGCRPAFLQGEHLTVVNARSGIRILTEVLKPGAVWMPAFLCDTILAGIPQGTPLRFYGITCNLRVASAAWIDQIQPGDLVFLIDYFGFATDAEICHAARARGAWILEDASQALLSRHVGANADFVLFSPRKLLAVPDGGVLVISNFENWPPIQLEPAPAAWSLKSIEAFVLRREFDLYGGERRFFHLFREVEREAPVGPYAMSGLARLLLEHAFDYPAIASRRRTNYQALAARLGPLAIFPELPDDVVPLGFPIRLSCRDDARSALFQNEIYPAIHWPIPQQVPQNFTESFCLAREILTLICDQRYAPEEMEQIAYHVADNRRDQHDCMTSSLTTLPGYYHPGYARSLAEFGIPVELPRSRGWLLNRAIPGSAHRDAMGCYPLFCCCDWTQLAGDLQQIDPVVSIALVTDPFGNFDRQLLETCFDRVIEFKQHYVVDLERPAESFISKHHRYYARRALQRICVEPVPPLDFLTDWTALYSHLVRRHGLHGIKAFSEEAFRQQLSLPGVVALRASEGNRTIAGHVWYVQGDVAYSHLGASNDAGYALYASYAIYFAAIDYFKDKVRWLELGAGAGAGSKDGGLTQFKEGWSTATRPAYFCGRILDHVKYEALLAEKQVPPGTTYFPAYRTGELI